MTGRLLGAWLAESMGASTATPEPTDEQLWSMTDDELDVFERQRAERDIGRGLAGELVVRFIGLLRGLQKEG